MSGLRITPGSTLLRTPNRWFNQEEWLYTKIARAAHSPACGGYEVSGHLTGGTARELSSAGKDE